MTMWTPETIAALPTPGKSVRSERASVRADILRRLRGVNDTMRSLVSAWDSARRLYDGRTYQPQAGSRWPQGWRFRMWGEFPENNPAVMLRHARTLHNLASALDDLAIRLANEAREVEIIAQSRPDAPTG